MFLLASCKRLLRSLATLLVLVLMVSDATLAATWYVEKDGSGDFAVIQDAVDVAASGDTIRIGVGRFDEAEEIVTPGWTKLTRVVVKQNTLTMIGTGDGQTIIGREERYQLEVHGYDQGLISSPAWNSETISLIGIRFENMESAVVADNNTRLVIRNCEFFGNRISVASLAGHHVDIDDTRFEGMGRDGYHVAAWSCDSLTLRNSSFVLPVDYFMAQGAVYVDGISETSIENCVIRNGWTGVQFESGTRLHISHCEFTGQSLYGFLSSGVSSSLSMSNCVFRNLRDGLVIQIPGNHVEVESSVFENVTRNSIRFRDLGTGFIRNCHLAKGPVWAVYDDLYSHEEYPEPVHFDMTGNWWGTTDADSIAAWIRDANDDPESQYIIDFEPFLDGPVPAEKTSLGGLKALFR